MTNNNLAGRKIAILVASGFEEVQMTDPQKTLIAAGAQTKVISRENGLVNGWHEDSWGHFFPIDADLSQTLAIDFDALLIPGGARSIAKLSEDPHAKRIVKAFLKGNQPVAAIGDATSLLATADEFAGRTVTGSEQSKATVDAKGGVWSDEPIVVDGMLITAQGSQQLADVLARLQDIVTEYAETLTDQAA
ncbi:MAG: DJ-1/PfpI family protein [Alphaproteobacteria bacterium]|nr:DJ-1/PfpI family protein [Alphaproteobacteria bacterium]MBU0799143.1 DJ-1/PfpI family protein [Alphaproteobacteria bacterium]MBU0888828.1 DJ-1/PfpI family protein [Alphaproteobacteria bacterium]MBU1813848.1 DJ-1/PfpI family protein [Alphaproteobacteria bacterium]MBU2090234.1 DJ-1/PfpI family protein [Alphaproteobacteria bacterium]